MSRAFEKEAPLDDNDGDDDGDDGGEARRRRRLLGDEEEESSSSSSSSFELVLRRRPLCPLRCVDAVAGVAAAAAVGGEGHLAGEKEPLRGEGKVRHGWFGQGGEKGHR